MAVKGKRVVVGESGGFRLALYLCGIYQCELPPTLVNRVSFVQIEELEKVKGSIKRVKGQYLLLVLVFKDQ